MVASGDSCASIAAAAGIDDATLLANNPNVDGECANIYPDEVSLSFLVVPGLLFSVYGGRLSGGQFADTPRHLGFVHCFDCDSV